MQCIQLSIATVLEAAFIEKKYVQKYHFRQIRNAETVLMSHELIDWMNKNIHK